MEVCPAKVGVHQVGTGEIGLIQIRMREVGVFKIGRLELCASQIAEATKGNMFGAWSNLVTGNRPDGLVECFLMEADGVVQLAAFWESVDAHDRAIGEEASHPAFAVFEAMDADPTHTVFKIVGHLGR